MTRSKLALFSKIALGLSWLALVIATHIPPESYVPPVGSSDKVLHALAYLALAFLLVTTWELSVGRLNRRHLGAAWLAVIAWGALDEITQIPVGRDGDFWDWTADAAGAAIGIMLFIFVRRLVERRGRSA